MTPYLHAFWPATSPGNGVRWSSVQRSWMALAAIFPTGALAVATNCDALNVQRWQNICSHDGDWLLVQITLANGKNLAFALPRSMVPEIRDYFDPSREQLEVLALKRSDSRTAS